MKKMDSEFLRYLKDECGMSEDEIATSSANEIFDRVLQYEGHGQFAGIAIRQWVKHVYGIDLDETSQNIYMKEQEI